MSVTVDQQETTEFFIAGGTLPLQSHSYLERAADAALREALLKGRFCYVLNSRQMGKSSLCVRTMSRLEKEGVRCAFIDITKIGGRNVTPEQWYAGMAIEIGRSLGLRAEILEYWKAEGHLSPMQRFFGSLHDVVLAKLENKIVIFVDEIDSTRSLSFNTDEFFAGVRECFNRRVQEPAYERMTFCFLGVAVPSDLIHDARTTPFNIGERIYLKDFTYEEVQPLAKMLGANGETILRRVFHWTNGHPFLTQSVCRALVASEAQTEKDVDDLIQRDLLEPKVRETNINLSDVGNRVLNGYAEGDDIAKFQADILSAYQKALSGKEDLPDDESNRITAVLKLSGLMRSDAKVLRVRNRIYERAFDRAWIKENMPGQELRRQRRAYLLGMARTSLAAAAIIAVIAYLAINNYRLAQLAARVAREKSYQAYVATMNLLPVAWDQKNLTQMDTLLQSQATESWKGMEWSFWDRMAHQADYESPNLGMTAIFYSFSPDFKQFVVTAGGKLIFVDSHDGRVLRTAQTGFKGFLSAPTWLPDGKRIVVSSVTATRSYGGGIVVSAEDGRTVDRLPSNFIIRALGSTDPQSALLIGVTLPNRQFSILDIATKKVHEIAPIQTLGGFSLTSDRHVLAVVVNQNGHSALQFVNLTTFKTVRSIPFPVQNTTTLSLLKDGRRAIAAMADGRVAVVDLDSDRILAEATLSNTFVTLRSGATADDRYAIATSRDRQAFLMEIGPTSLRVIRTYPEANQAFLLPDGSRIITQYWSAKFYKLDSRAPVRSFPVGPGRLLLWHRDNHDNLMVGGKRLSKYEIHDGKGLRGFPANDTLPNPSGFLAIAAADPWVLVQQGKQCVLQDLLAGKPLLSLDVQPTSAVVESLGGSKVALCLDGQTIEIWDLKTKKKLHSIKWPSEVLRLYADEQGAQLMVCNEFACLGKIDVPTGTVTWDNTPKRLGHGQGILRGRFSRDGTRFVTAADDDSAALWDTKTGDLVSRFMGSAQSVTDADISLDDKRVATVCDDLTVRLWDAKTGQQLTTLASNTDTGGACMFSSDGKWLITGGSADTIKLWPISPR